MKKTTASACGISESEHGARVNLAAAYRLCGHYGWTSLIYNHISLRVPGEPDMFLVKPDELLFEEVTASSLLKVPSRGSAEADETINRAGYTIHTAVLHARPDIHCCVHVHTNAGMAVSACADGLLPVNQGAMRFHERVSYHDYEGIAHDLDESARIARDLGPRNKAMILRNHGLLTAGIHCADAMSLMRSLIATCETQLMLQASGCTLTFPSVEVRERTARQWDALDTSKEWPAQLRFLDARYPGFRH